MSIQYNVASRNTFKPNQKVKIINMPTMSKIVLNQNTSTPGIRNKFKFVVNKTYIMRIDIITGPNKVFLWNNIVDNKIILNNGPNIIILNVGNVSVFELGICVQNPKAGNTIIIKTFKISLFNKNDKQIKKSSKEFIERKHLLINKTYQSTFNKKNVDQIYISPSLKLFNDKMKNTFNLRDYYNKKNPAIIFGLFDAKDLSILKSHTGKKYLIWGGSDIDKMGSLPVIKTIKNIEHIAISQNNKERLQSKGINSTLIEFNLAKSDPQFKPLTKFGNSIYIYNGIGPNRENIYGKIVYDKIMKRLPEFNYILSNKLHVPANQISKTYANCFVGLRLTLNDGNANTVQEMEIMGIPVIHNGQHKNSIKWRSINDIIYNIVDQNIRQINKTIIAKKKILFVCSDYPSYGGAATNAYNMIEYYRRMNCKVFGLFLHDESITQETLNKYKNGIIICKSADADKQISKINAYFQSPPQLIIFRNNVGVDIINKNYSKIEKWFLIPGLFKKDLNTLATKITDKKIMDKYFHTKKLDLMNTCNISYSGSHITKHILSKFYNKNVDIFYFNWINYIEKLKNTIMPNGNREFDVGFIVSNFSRVIKNVHFGIEVFRYLPNYKKILIGKDSSKYSSIPNTTCVDLIDQNEVINYMKRIKVLIIPSFYESCSNTLIEAYINGCRIVASDVNKTGIININTMDDYNMDRWCHQIRDNIGTYGKLILVTSTQYPGFGGAATNAYAIIKYLRSQGHRVAGLFFHNGQVNCDPDKIGGVWLLQMSIWQNNMNLHYATDVKDNIVRYLGYEPDIIFCKNYMAPIYSHELFGDSKIIYLISGSNHFASILTGKSANDVINDNTTKNYKLIADEEKAFNVSRYAIANSKLTLDIYKKIYHKYSNKLYNKPIDTTQQITYLIKPHTSYNKEYDILLTCSQLDRVDKNNKFLINVLKDPRLNKYKKIIIGGNNKDFANIPNATLTGILSHDKTIDYMSKSRVLLFPSLYDSNPNTTREAYYNKCLVIMTTNVGMSEKFPEFCICKDFTIEEWVTKTINSVDNYQSLLNNYIIDFSSNTSLVNVINTLI